MNVVSGRAGSEIGTVLMNWRQPDTVGDLEYSIHDCTIHSTGECVEGCEYSEHSRIACYGHPSVATTSMFVSLLMAKPHHLFGGEWDECRVAKVVYGRSVKCVRVFCQRCHTFTHQMMPSDTLATRGRDSHLRIEGKGLMLAECGDCRHKALVQWR